MTKTNKENYMYKICIDPGHGGKDPGAVNGKYQEKDFNLDIAKKLAFFLESEGEFEIIFTRTEDVYVSLDDRCKIANKSKCNIFVSIHINSATNPSANGIETLCFGEFQDRNLAKYIQKALITATKAKDRGVKHTNMLYVITNTKMPAVLVEAGFLSNREDLESLIDDFYLDKIAGAIAVGICDYFQIPTSDKVTVSNNNRYKTIDEIPEYAKESVKKMCEQGAIKGNGDDLDLSEDMLRLIVIFDRYLNKKVN